MDFVPRKRFTDLLVVGLLLLGSIGPQAASAADNALIPLNVCQVEVGGEIGRRIDVTVNNNLLVLDVEKDFLTPYRTKTSRDGYKGLGKLIDATVLFAAHTKSEKVIALKKRLVKETIKTQKPDGYIGLMAASARMWGMWDIHDLSYIIFGLTSDYHYFGEKRSLEAARKAADYILQRWSTMPVGWPQQTHIATHVSVTGLESAMLALYRETQDRRYLDFCIRQRALPDWDLGIVIGRRELIEGHVYGYLARCLAQLELHRLQPDKKLLAQTRRTVRFMTGQDGASITGAVGQWEIWTDDQDGRQALGETCATAYQLRIYDSLLRSEGNSRYGDLMERTIYNTLFGAQSPDGRRIRYYTPLEGDREYFPMDAYCCPNNYRRIIAKLPAMVYYQSKPGLTVNLYTPSEATLDLEDGLSLRVRQETDYPTSGHVTIHLDPSKPARFPLRLRIPRWCDKATVAVNGQPWKAPATPGQFLSIEREWTAGDRVTIDMPMAWRLVLGRKRQSGRAAVMRGPVVFCLNPTLNKSLQKQDAVEVNFCMKKPGAVGLGFIMIDPASLKDLPGNNAVRPGGMACTVKAGNDGFTLTGVSGKLSLTLTEFPDPEGKVVYFRLPDLSVAVPDELFSGNCKQCPASIERAESAVCLPKGKRK